MIDSLDTQREKAAQSDIREKLGVETGGYGVVTLHRPSNVTEPTGLERLAASSQGVSRASRYARAPGLR